MSSTSTYAGKAFFDRIPATANDEAEKCQALYDEWAKTYDEDLSDASHGYVGPFQAAKAIAELSKKDGQTVLDAGCGTGLSGVAVRTALGPSAVIDGIDISTGMLEIAAKKNVYRELQPADLSKDIAIESDKYDVVVCVGTMTGGHVGPSPALGEFVRVLNAGGLVVATIREDVFERGGYEAEVRRIESEGLATVVSTDSVPYREAQGVSAKLLVMKKK